MSPPKSRGHLLVNLAKHKGKDDLPEEVSQTVQLAEDVTLDTPQSISLPNAITDQDLEYSVDFQNSRCSGIFSDVLPDDHSRTIENVSPILEFIDHSKTNAREPNDVEISQSSPLATSINLLFAANDKIQVLHGTNNNENQQIKTVTDGYEDNGAFTIEKDFSGDQTVEKITFEKEVETNGSGGPTIEEAQIQATVEEHRYNIVDPDYIPAFNADDSRETPSDIGRPKKGRKRKFNDQNSSIRKKKANTNQRYYSINGKKVSPKKFNNKNCGCPLKCTEKLSMEQRKKEFENFWASGSYESRCAIIQGSVEESQKKRSYSMTSCRAFTRQYKLCNTSICKMAFLTTLSISQSRVDVALKKFREQIRLNDNRGVKSGGQNAIRDDQLQKIKEFINNLPKYTSHYCRDTTSAVYLAQNLNLTIIYDLYKEKYEDHVSFSRFRQSFYNDFNLRFKKPQKDTCLRCDLYKANKTAAVGEQLELLEKEHNDHLDHAYKLRDQMKKDLAAAKTDPSIETLTFDLEKTHCLPRLPTGIVYYKRQLNLHNLGIHCGTNSKGYFFIWLEHEAGRGTQEVGSCLRKFINEFLKPGVTHLILWSDSCGGQNRSIKMVLMLLHILQSHATLKKITIRFLQPGHTYLPNDSEFGDVECALKSQLRFYTAEDYISVMENCRRKNKFVVKRLQKEDFKSVSPLQDRITNRKSDVAKEKISWLSTFEIELHREEPSKLYMKSKLDEESQVVDISKGGKGRKQIPNFAVDLPILYPSGRELSAAKVQDLKELLKLIPSDAKSFYNFLKNVRSADFVDDADGMGNSIDYDVEESFLED